MQDGAPAHTAKMAHTSSEVVPGYLSWFDKNADYAREFAGPEPK